MEITNNLSGDTMTAVGSRWQIEHHEPWHDHPLITVVSARYFLLTKEGHLFFGNSRDADGYIKSPEVVFNARAWSLFKKLG